MDLWVLFLPFQWAYAACAYLFSFSLVSGPLGFGCGISLGLFIGYLAFIYTLSMDVEKHTVKESLLQANGEVDKKTLDRLVPEIHIWVKNPDYDRVDWINTLVREMWPYIDKAVEAQVQVIVPPLIQQYKPAAIHSIAIDKLSLGDLPPTLAGIKVYDTTDDEMIIEPVLKWAGNPNIIVSATAFGLKATVQLVDLTVYATARVTLKPLVPVFPCFSRISVSLMAKPTVDFGLKVIGGDVMAIPGLYNFVQETIASIASGLVLWPKSLELYNGDDEGGLRKPVGWLYVQNMRAKNLTNTGLFTVSDPYVRLSLGRKMGMKTSSVKHNELSPSWEEEDFQLLVRDLSTEELEFHVFHKEEGADKLMATARFALKDLVAEEVTTVTLELVKEGKKALTPAASQRSTSMARGSPQLSVDLMFKKFGEDEDGGEEEEEVTAGEVFPDSLKVGGGLLKVTVHSGEGLGGKSYSNPFVEVRFRDGKKKTKVMKKATECDFDEPPFYFVVEAPPVEEKLFVQVWGKNLTPVLSVVSSKENLGHATIPLRDVVTNLRLNDWFALDQSQAGRVKVELQWIEKKGAGS